MALIQPWSFPLASTQQTGLQSSGTQRLEYIFHSGFVEVFDIYHQHRFLKKILYPSGKVRGAVANAETGMVYISTLAHKGTVIKLNLRNDQIEWVRYYVDGIDSPAISPNGKKLYMASDSGGMWNVIDTENGDILGVIHGPESPHNTMISQDGGKLYMGGGDNALLIASTENYKVQVKIGPLKSRIRPFTLNASETLAFMTVSSFLGFQIGDTKTGEVLFTIPVPGFTDDGSSSQSHGISMSPDESEIYLIDRTNQHVHIFDVSNLAEDKPRLVASIALRGKLGKPQNGWLQHSKDGRYVYVGGAGDIIDTASRKTVFFLKSLANSQLHLEIHFELGKPVWAENSRSSPGHYSRK